MRLRNWYIGYAVKMMTKDERYIWFWPVFILLECDSTSYKSNTVRKTGIICSLFSVKFYFIYTFVAAYINVYIWNLVSREIIFLVGDNKGESK